MIWLKRLQPADILADGCYAGVIRIWGKYVDEKRHFPLDMMDRALLSSPGTVALRATFSTLVMQIHEMLYAISHLTFPSSRPTIQLSDNPINSHKETFHG